ncbi:MAG: electron transport complex subunit RsxG [Woeseiaceae bacterium]|nr:electron transport complex subunit RsxG [Woeseiaceae bacterium]
MAVSAARNGLTLAVIAAICTTLVATTYHFTRDRIAANEQAWLERRLKPALAGLDYEGSLSESRLVLAAPHGLPGRDDAIIYRVHAGGEPVAALFAVTAPDGYSGTIRILVGVSYEGVVTGVRILSHRETPGLGDQIESSKSDWVHQFEGKSLGDPPLDDWAIRRDGGVFDQLTGASVTPRAVIKAIRDTLLYFDAHRASIFARAATGDDE